MEKIQKIDINSLSLGLCIGILPWSEKWNTWAIILLVLFLLFRFFSSKAKVHFNIWKFLAASALFWISLLWLLNTDDKITGWKYIERIASSLIFPLLFSLIVVRVSIKLHVVFLVFLSSSFLRYVFLLVQYIDWELVYILDYWKEVLLQFNQISLLEALHPSYFALFLGFCVLISYNFLIVAKSLKRRIFWFTLLTVFLLMVISLGAKMPLFACIISLLIGVLTMIVRMNSGKVKYLVVTITGFLIILFVLLKTPNGVLQDVDNYYRYFKGEKLDMNIEYENYGTNYSFETWSRTNRIFIWKSTVKLIKKNIIAGVGTGDMKYELNNQYINDGQNYLADQNTNTHNQFLDFLVKFGLLGFVAIVIAFFCYYKSAWSRGNNLYFLFLVFIMFCMLTENILNRQLGIVFFFFFNSIFYFSIKSENIQKVGD